MKTFSIITLFSALSAAAPHAINHFRLHEKSLHLDTLALKPLVDRELETTNLLERRSSGLGSCASASDCPSGMCCSQFGFCGVGASYCGGTSGSSTSPSGAAAAPLGAPSGAPSGPPMGPPSGAPSGSPPTAPSGSPSGSPPTAPSGAPSGAPPAPSSSASPGNSTGGGGSGAGLGNTYTFYTGDGSPSAGWPSESDWPDFDSLWAANEPTIMISCTEFGESNNSEEETSELKSSLQSVGSSSGLDPRFLLAIMMQESKGCVRVPTTDNGVVNPGLFQSHDGAGTCNKDGSVQNPCPAQEITLMVENGASGTPAGAGLKQCVSQSTATDAAQKVYQAAAIYNSGSLPQNLDDNTATPCYSSDIANRLTGWTTAATKCTLT